MTQLLHTKQWYLNGKRHREDGPAIEYPGGRKEWWLNGKLHRENGPAIEYGDGNKEWWVNGKLHRVDGPASKFLGKESYYLNGQEYSYEEWDRLRKMLWLT